MAQDSPARDSLKMTLLGHTPGMDSTVERDPGASARCVMLPDAGLDGVGPGFGASHPGAAGESYPVDPVAVRGLLAIGPRLVGPGVNLSDRRIPVGK